MSMHKYVEKLRKKIPEYDLCCCYQDGSNGLIRIYQRRKDELLFGKLRGPNDEPLWFMGMTWDAMLADYKLVREYQKHKLQQT